MNHIFYQTKTYYSNTGDVLINQALIQRLRDYGKLHANCEENIPTHFLEALGVKDEECIHSRNEFEFIKSVIRCGIQSRRGGNNVFVVSGPGDMYGGGLKLVVRSFLSGLVFPIFRLIGVKIVRIGRSVGPITRLMALSEWVRGLFLNHYYVRDSQSLRRCHEMGIKKTKMCPDLSWLFDQTHEKSIQQTDTIMVNLRNAIFDDVEPEFIESTLQKCEEVLATFNQLLHGKMKVIVAYQIQEDEAFSRCIYDRIKEQYPTKYIEQQIGLDQLAEVYKRVDYHVSNRMHSLLCGYKYGSLPIALIDTQRHVKISATMRDCDLNELMVDINEELNVEQIAYLVRERRTYLETLWVREREAANEIECVLKEIFS